MLNKCFSSFLLMTFLISGCIFLNGTTKKISIPISSSATFASSLELDENTSFQNIKNLTLKSDEKPKLPDKVSLNYSNLSSNQVNLNWEKSSGADGYKIYRASNNDSNYSIIATVSNTTFKNTGLKSSSRYWYIVRAYNSNGESEDSIHISITTSKLVQKPQPQAQPTSKKIILGYSTYYNTADVLSFNSIKSNTSMIDEIATDTFVTDSNGNLSGLVPHSQVTYANNNNNIKTLAMITNNFDGNIAKALLENTQNRQALINNILVALKTNGYKGVNIDLEGIYYYDRDYFTTFMSELYSTLHTQGFYVSIAIPAKNQDNIKAPWNGAFDYKKLSNYSDQILIMTYDEHWLNGQPGPIASISWVESVIKYAISTIPKEKILLGTAAYGYDWSSNPTKSYGILGIYKLASTYSVDIKWDNESKSPYFNYSDSQGVSHTVWFENAESLKYKLDLVNSYNLSGIGIWRLGFENGDYWTSIKTKFNR